MNKSDIIASFYKAFQDLDSERMVSFYHKDIEFEDPAFGKLKGERAKNMWRMLIASQKGKDFRIEYSEIDESSNKASASWEAFYTFSKSGRKVHNRIKAEFEIKDGKIVKHVDNFNLRNWAKQAIGFKGWLLGGTSFFKSKLQKQTNRLLDKYEGAAAK